MKANRSQIKFHISPAAQRKGGQIQAMFTDNRSSAHRIRAQQQSIQRKNSIPVVQRLGENVNMVDESDRHFDTPDGAQRLRVNPDADAYLESWFERGSKAKHAADTSLGEKLAHAMHFTSKGIPYNKQGKIDAFESHQQPVGESDSREERGLGVMLHGEAATCWEKVALFHLVLAELGIPSFVEGGYKKSTGSGHAWLVIPPHEDLFGGKTIAISPTSGNIYKHSHFEKTYNIEVPQKQVATPKAVQSPRDIEKAIREFVKLSGMPSIVKKAVIGTVELKAERGINDKRRAAEREEFEQLLEGLRNIGK